MARKLTIDMNQVAPSGYVELYKSIKIDDRDITRVWAEFWDVSIRKDMMHLKRPETESPKLWLWHGCVDNEVKWFTEGNKINTFVKSDKPDENDAHMYILKADKKKKVKKK
jgi:hypothetical protein